jgi:hypothetical protein
MKTIACATFVLFLITLATPWSASAQTSGPSASGTYKFALEDDFTKFVEFNVVTAENGTTTGQMTFRDEAGLSEQDPDGEGGEQTDPKAEFYMTANLDSLTIDKNRAVMGGTVTDSSNRSYIGRWVQLVVEDNGDDKDMPDQLSWCLCKPEESGWVPSDAEVPGDDGAWSKWWATDAEQKDDPGVESKNIIPGSKKACTTFPLAAYEFAAVKSAEGQIQVQQ